MKLNTGCLSSTKGCRKPNISSDSALSLFTQPLLLGMSPCPGPEAPSQIAHSRHLGIGSCSRLCGCTALLHVSHAQTYFWTLPSAHGRGEEQWPSEPALEYLTLFKSHEAPQNAVPTPSPAPSHKAWAPVIHTRQEGEEWGTREVALTGQAHFPDLVPIH